MVGVDARLVRVSGLGFTTTDTSRGSTKTERDFERPTGDEASF